MMDPSAAFHELDSRIASTCVSVTATVAQHICGISESRKRREEFPDIPPEWPEKAIPYFLMPPSALLDDACKASR